MKQKIIAVFSSVSECQSDKVLENVESWEGTFKQAWENDSDEWIELTRMLPVPSCEQETVIEFDKLTAVSQESIPFSCLVFLSKVASGKLNARFWADQLSPEAVRLCAGLVNLHDLAREEQSAFVKDCLDDLQHNVVSTLVYYPITLVGIALYHPDLVRFEGVKCQIKGGLEVPILNLRERIISWSYKDARKSLSTLLERGKDRKDEALKLLGNALGSCAESVATLLRLSLQEGLKMPYEALLNSLLFPIPDQLLVDDSEVDNLVLVALQNERAFSERDRLAILRHFSFSSRGASRLFKEFCVDMMNLADTDREEVFRLWSRYLVPEDEFIFGWYFLHAQSRTRNEMLFGADLDARINSLKKHLINGWYEKDFMHHHSRLQEEAWNKLHGRRRAWIEFFRSIISLIEIESKGYYGRKRDFQEISVRQRAALEALKKQPEAVPVAVRGILDLAENHWNQLDPIILGLPKKSVVKVLSEYTAGRVNGPHAKRFHAEVLLRHLKGEPLAGQGWAEAGGSGLLDAVENLIEVSRSRIPRDRSQTWLGDIGIESLWRGAIDVACKEFGHTFDHWGGHYEHEPVFDLAAAIARHLEDTNKTILKWLTDRRTPPISISLSVRRFQVRQKGGAAGEGGPSGTRADLGLIFDCDVPGLAQAAHVTLIQAKSLWKRKWSHGWERSVPIDTTQLEGLLRVSEHAHYMFMFNIELIPAPLIVPARFLQDVLAAQSTNTVPIPVLIRAAKDLPSFIVHDVVGLWTGDPDQQLVKKARAGTDDGVGPWVAIDIRVSANERQEDL